MSSIAEHRHLVDIMRPLASASRPQLAANWAVTCPRCGHDSVHLGPNGRYCERGECEWEAQPAPLAVHGCALPACYICGCESDALHFAGPWSRHSLGLLPMCASCCGTMTP